MIERYVPETIDGLDMCTMVHTPHASALAASIDGTLHTVLVELPVSTEKEAYAFAAGAVRSLLRYFAAYPDLLGEGHA